MSSILGTST